MKVTKYEHATLLLSIGDDSLVIDPGMFLSAVDFGNVAAIIITHEHGDHWTPDQLGRILDKNPNAVIYGTEGVKAAASGFEVHAVKEGDTIEAGPFTLRFYGDKHAVIHESVPVPDNVGVLVNDELYYAGDSFVAPENVAVGTLAVPAGAPWLKISEVMDYVDAVAPKRSFAVHEMLLSDAGKSMSNDRITTATEWHDGRFVPLAPGESLEL